MAKLSQETIKERIANKQLKIKLLKSARKKLRPYSGSGICSALNDSVSGGYFDNPKWDAVDELVEYISKALGVYAYYTSWVRSKNTKLDDLCNDNFLKFGQQAKKARQAWIDWMIKCLTEDIDILKGKLK